MGDQSPAFPAGTRTVSTAAAAAPGAVAAPATAAKAAKMTGAGTAGTGGAGRCGCARNRRYIVLAFCFLANVVCFVDRTNIAVAVLAIQSDYGWTDAEMGVALSSFFYGYACMQIPSGWLSTRFGGKRVLAVCVALWSMFTIITPLAVRVSFGTLLAARVGMGLAEAASMPCVHSIIGAWFPPSEVSFAISFSTSGQAVGTIIALMSSPMVSWYWPSVFYFYGVVGLVWTVLFAIFCPGAPIAGDRHAYSVELVDTVGQGTTQIGDKDTSCFTEELDHAACGGNSGGVSGGGDGSCAPPGAAEHSEDLELAAVRRGNGKRSTRPESSSDGDASDGSDCGQWGADPAAIGPCDNVVAAAPPAAAQPGAGKQRPPARRRGMLETLRGCGRVMRALCRPSFVAIVVAHCGHNFGYYVMLMWLPAYFASLGIDLASVGFVTLLPYVAIFIADSAWSKAMDVVLQRANREPITRPSALQRHCGCFGRVLCPRRFAASKASRDARGVFHLLVIRKLSQALAFVAPTLFLSILISLPDVTLWAATLLMCLGLGLNSASHSGYWANLIDLGHPDHAGFLCGVSNTFATIPGIVGNLVTGWILDASGSWNMVFITAMGNFVVGLIVFMACADAVPLPGLGAATKGSSGPPPRH